MKSLLLIFTLTLCVNANYLNTKSNNICIYDLEPNNNKSGWCYTKSKNNKKECDKNLNIDDLIDGYEYKSNKCILKNDLKLTGLTQTQWSVYMAILAHIMGFTMLFMMSYISVLVAKK